MLRRSTSGVSLSAVVALFSAAAGCQASVAASAAGRSRGAEPRPPAATPAPAAPAAPLPPGVSGTSTSPWKGLPIACGKGQTLVLDHAQLPELEDTLVHATGDCRVTINASRL